MVQHGLRSATASEVTLSFVYVGIQ